MRAPTQDVRLVVIGYGIASRERSSNCLYRPRIHKARGRRRLRATADGGKEVSLQSHSSHSHTLLDLGGQMGGSKSLFKRTGMAGSSITSAGMRHLKDRRTSSTIGYKPRSSKTIGSWRMRSRATRERPALERSIRKIERRESCYADRDLSRDL